MNYYDVLGVSKTDSLDDIKKAWKTLAKKYHPDRCKQSNATEKLQQINVAFQWIKANHKQQSPPTQEVKPKQQTKPVIERYARLTLKNTIEIEQWLVDTIDVDLTILIGNSKFNYTLTKGTKLPYKIIVKNQYNQLFPITFVEQLPECMI